MLQDLPAQGKPVLQQVGFSWVYLWLPRNFSQSEVVIHATCNSLICYKTGLIKCRHIDEIGDWTVLWREKIGCVIRESERRSKENEETVSTQIFQKRINLWISFSICARRSVKFGLDRYEGLDPKLGYHGIVFPLWSLIEHLNSRCKLKFKCVNVQLHEKQIIC